MSFAQAYGRPLDTLPVGSVIQSALNLEKTTGGRWLQLDGRYILRSSVAPEFSAQYPIGVFTSTNRTLAAAPGVYYTGAASSTYFVIPATTGTACMQYSTDGATWSQTSLVTPASCQSSCIIWTGSRFIASTNGTAAGPICTTGDNPNSTWTQTTNAAVNTSGSQTLCYSPSLALTVYHTGATSTSIYTLADGATSWVARTKTSSGTNGICWTGSRFVMNTSTPGCMIQYSTDGINWIDSKIADTTSAASIAQLASDGNGTVVGVLTDSFLVSLDHGDNWRRIFPPAEAIRGSLNDISSGATSTYNTVSYINGMFVSNGAHYKTLWSKDGMNWMISSPGVNALTQCTTYFLIYKAGIYTGINASLTTTWSATEDTSKFRLPNALLNRGNGSTYLSNTSDQPLYVKVLP